MRLARGPVALIFMLALSTCGLSACGGSALNTEQPPVGPDNGETSPPEQELEVIEPPTPDPKPAAENAENPDGNNGTVELDEECVDAFSLLSLVKLSLEVRAEQAPLTEADIGELFSDTGRYADQLPAETREHYNAYYEAAHTMIGQPEEVVEEILARPDVQEAIAGATDKQKNTVACEI